MMKPRQRAAPCAFEITFAAGWLAALARPACEPQCKGELPCIYESGGEREREEREREGALSERERERRRSLPFDSQHMKCRSTSRPRGRVSH